MFQGCGSIRSEASTTGSVQNSAANASAFSQMTKVNWKSVQKFIEDNGFKNTESIADMPIGLAFYVVPTDKVCGHPQNCLFSLGIWIPI